LDLESIEGSPATPTIGSGDSWSAKQAEVPTPIVSPPRQRGKAAASPLRISATPASTEASLPESTSNNDAKTPTQKKTRGRRQRRRNSNAQGTMSAPTKSVPPHLRRKAAAAAAAAAAQQKVESSATNGSSVASELSKPDQGVKLHSTP